MSWLCGLYKVSEVYKVLWKHICRDVRKWDFYTQPLTVWEVVCRVPPPPVSDCSLKRFYRQLFYVQVNCGRTREERFSCSVIGTRCWRCEGRCRLQAVFDYYLERTLFSGSQHGKRAHFWEKRGTDEMGPCFTLNASQSMRDSDTEQLHTEREMIPFTASVLGHRDIFSRYSNYHSKNKTSFCIYYVKQ